jgi:hypothetical protein
VGRAELINSKLAGPARRTEGAHWQAQDVTVRLRVSRSLRGTRTGERPRPRPGQIGDGGPVPVPGHWQIGDGDGDRDRGVRALPGVSL